MAPKILHAPFDINATAVIATAAPDHEKFAASIHTSFSMPRCAEHLVAADTEYYGYSTAIHTGGSRRCDMMAMHYETDAVLQLQVKHTTQRPDGLYMLRFPFDIIQDPQNAKLIYVYVLFAPGQRSHEKLVFHEAELFDLFRSSPRLGSSYGYDPKKKRTTIVAPVFINNDGHPWSKRIDLTPYHGDCGWGRAIKITQHKRTAA